MICNTVTAHPTTALSRKITTLARIVSKRFQRPKQ